MTGQIPPYGANFRLEQRSCHPVLANRAFVLKADPDWFIRSDKTSKAWQVYWKVPGTGASFETATAMLPEPLPTFGLAMARLLEGIEQGFYAARKAAP
jgi:hypothetical protein